VIRVGVIGCGAMGRRHAAAAAADPRCALGWVSDREAGAARDLAAALRCAVGPGPVDLAVVATSATAHEAAVRSVDAGWWLIEKPLAPTVEAAERLAGPRVRVGMIERFNPMLRGRSAPRSVHLRRHGPPTPRGADVDALADLLVHDIDLCLGWAGPALAIADVEVRARRADGAIEACAVRLRNQGFEARIEVSRVASARERYAVLDGIHHDLGSPGVPDAITAQWAALLDEVAGGPTLLATAEDALAGLRLVERIRHLAEGR
jgi:predicted dehydrogenase